eukprot:1161635-Pelagomonas_calceolata.AAC.5
MQQVAGMGSRRLCSTGLSSTQGDAETPLGPTDDPQGSCSSNQQQEDAHPTSTWSRPYHHHRYYSTFGPGGRPSAQDEQDDRARWKALSSHEREIDIALPGALGHQALWDVSNDT